LYPVWMFAALSLNILPLPGKKANFDSFLEERNPEAFKAYSDRCVLLDQNLNNHPRLIDLEHKRRQKGRFGEIISIRDACHFLHERQLDGREAMIRALCPELSVSVGAEVQADGSPRASMRRVETSEEALLHQMNGLPRGAVYLDEIEKGARYKIYALGALILFLEEILSNPDANLARYVKGEGNLNMSKVGGRLHEILADNNIHTLGDRPHSSSALAGIITTASKQVRPVKKGR